MGGACQCIILNKTPPEVALILVCGSFIFSESEIAIYMDSIRNHGIIGPPPPTYINCNIDTIKKPSNNGIAGDFEVK
jgi:hypothetical protein